MRYYIHTSYNRNVEPVVYRINMGQEGLAIRTIIRVKGHSIKAIVDSRVSIFIITLLVVKQLRLQMSLADRSSIVIIN